MEVYGLDENKLLTTLQIFLTTNYIDSSMFHLPTHLKLHQLNNSFNLQYLDYFNINSRCLI